MRTKMKLFSQPKGPEINILGHKQQLTYNMLVAKIFNVVLSQKHSYAFWEQEMRYPIYNLSQVMHVITLATGSSFLMHSPA